MTLCLLGTVFDFWQQNLKHGSLNSIGVILMRSKSRSNVEGSSTSQKLDEFPGFLVKLDSRCGPSLHTLISGREKEKGRKAKVSDSWMKMVPLKRPRVPLGSFFPSLVTVNFRGSQNRRS